MVFLPEVRLWSEERSVSAEIVVRETVDSLINRNLHLVGESVETSIRLGLSIKIEPSLVHQHGWNIHQGCRVQRVASAIVKAELLMDCIFDASTVHLSTVHL